MNRSLHQRLQAFPSQLILTIAWTVIGLPVCIILRESLLWVILMSWYTVVIGHFAGHLAWRAEQAAGSDAGQAT